MEMSLSLNSGVVSSYVVSTSSCSINGTTLVYPVPNLSNGLPNFCTIPSGENINKPLILRSICI